MTSTPTSQSATVSDPASNYAGDPKGCSDYGDGCQCNLCKDRDYWFAQKAAATPKPQIPQSNGLGSHALKPDSPFTWAAGYWDLQLYGINRSPEPLAAEAKVQYGYNCARCNCRNEYAGPEHMKNGVYICCECKLEANYRSRSRMATVTTGRPSSTKAKRPRL